MCYNIFRVGGVMDKIKKNLPVILLSVACTLLLVIVILLIVNNNTFKFNNSSSNNKVEKENVSDVEDKEEVEVIDETEEVTTNNSSTSSSDNVSSNTNTTTTNTDTTTEEKSESALLSYFNSQAQLFSNSSTDESFTSKLKASFVSIVDFIFYDKEIKGYTFSELTNTAKLKVISIALAIDNKIDTYFPNYKETIKDKYTSIKGTLALKYLEITASFCGNDPETCSMAKENFDSMKNSFGLTFDLLKELFTNGSTKVKELYENWRDE